MKKLVLLLVIGAIIAFSGCTTEPAGGGEGTVEILVSDQPADIDAFTYLNVKLSEIRVFKTGSGFETYQPAVDSFDLTKLKGDNALALINATLDEGTYTKIEFHVESIEGETSEGAADVQVPSNKLIITKSFDVEPNKTISFVFDINVVKKGQSNGYNLLPVISGSGVVGKDIAEAKVRRVTREQAQAHAKGTPSQPGQGQSGQESTARLTIHEAKAIAQGTECTEKGNFKDDDYTYNENSNTWWIDLEMKPGNEQQGCNPACVVSEETNESEINWRCTGALPPGGDGGVGQDGAPVTGQFSLFVTDAPADIGDFSELTVSLSSVMIHKSADGDNGSGGEWLEFGLNVSSFDLTQLVDGNVLEVLGVSLSEGMYTQIRLEVESASGLVGNETVTIHVPSGTLKIVKPFMITANQELEFLFDINVVRKGNGNNNQYNLLPVIGNSGVWDSQNQNPAVCGNGICEIGEDNETCPEDCLIEPTANESICGDNVIDDGEDCDGTSLNNNTCVDLGYTGGDISCTANCTFDLSACINGTGTECGNGLCEEGETPENCPDDCELPAPTCIAEINCTNYCDNDILFINGTCLEDGSCSFINVTCDFGCSNATCINQTV